MARTQQQVLESIIGNQAMQISALIAQLEKTEEELKTRNEQLSALNNEKNNSNFSISAASKNS